MDDAIPDPLIARLMSASGRETAMSALAAFSGHIAAFDPARLSPGQATVLAGELRTLERRMSAVREALDIDAAETAALADWRDAYAARPDAGRALLDAADPGVAREVERQAEAERWFARLDQARARFAMRLGSAAGDTAAAGPSPAVIRSLSRVNACLDALLQDAGARRAAAPDAMTRLRMWSLDALGIDPLARGGAAAENRKNGTGT